MLQEICKQRPLVWEGNARSASVPPRVEASIGLDEQRSTSLRRSFNALGHGVLRPIDANSRTVRSKRHLSVGKPVQLSRSENGEANVKNGIIARKQATASTIRSYEPDVPLRKRSPSSLLPSDFKVNPLANQGYDYAFTEVVRNKDQRRCLPGCTRPECCGNRIRKIIEITGAAGITENEEALLKRYMGYDYARVKWMNPEEKAKILEEALVEEFARKYSRHRYVFARPTTPPGFWNTEFPTTQEAIEERERALKSEREKVIDRRREAMRPNGRWLFRDE